LSVRRDTDDVFEPGGAPPPWPSGWSVEGVIAALEPLVLEPRRARLREVVAARLGSVTVVMDAPHDPHNGAAVLRSCDAFGVGELNVVPRLEPFAVSGAVAKGTERWVDVVLHGTPEAAVDALARRGFELVSTHPEGALLPEDLARVPKLALVLGNEHDGICEALERGAPRSVRIPMRGFVESLNVSVSAAVLLAFATRERAGDLPEADRRALYARGLVRSVPRASEVLAAMQAR
jgi:tRNA (guanosine-2'-O-)-methyltransferase